MLAVAAAPGHRLSAAEAAAPLPGIKRIYITHFSHTDFGFTDLQTVCRELQRRYLDIALDAVLATMNGSEDKKFFWTAESLVAVQDWWDAASSSRRKAFLKAIRSGQLEVSALPFNQTPFLDHAQWQRMLHWIPEELWREFKPAAAMQNDVNGFPRAGAMALLDRGIRHLFMGINADSGGAPFSRPSAFWWKMPDGGRLFVWLNDHYGSGYDYFEASEWRRGPVPAAADARFRPPRAGDFFRTDEASLRAAHQHCLKRVEGLQTAGYPYDVLTIAVTSQWRMDNDPPFPPLAEFVAAWNKLGLKPELVLTTASKAIQALEKAAGNRAPEYEGEFTDWWANGTASAPREVAASRIAKRLLTAAQSPLWGQFDGPAAQTLDSLYRDLCLFDEHTWGSSWSVALPYSLDTQAQFMEKSLFAYRPMARAEWLLSQRARPRLLPEGQGFFLGNPATQPFSGWIRMPATCLRKDYKSLEDPEGGARRPLHFEMGIQAWGRPQNPGDLTRENSSATFPDNVPGQVARFWVEGLAGNSFRKLRLSTQTAEEKASSDVRPRVLLDTNGWPASAQWPVMKKPLFLPGLGDFVAIKVNAFAPRWMLHDIAGAGNEQRRNQLRREKLEEVWSEAEAKAAVEETPHTLRYMQGIQHPRLEWATRRLELWKREPRARFTLRFYRLSSDAPEIFYVVFPLPCKGVLPRVSCGGLPFTPYTDQLPGTCRDYFGIDGWADYATPEGHWLWVSRDAPLVTFGGPQAWARRQTAPDNANRVLAMLFNNFWYTNFAGDEHGVMEFQFDLVWREKEESPGQMQRLAESSFIEPVVMINSGGTEDPRVIQHLFQP